jgi:hypothetical protein
MVSSHKPVSKTAIVEHVWRNTKALCAGYIPAVSKRGTVRRAATEVQAIMETRAAQSFNGQTIGVEAHVADSWAGVKVPGYTDTRSTENATQSYSPHERDSD